MDISFFLLLFLRRSDKLIDESTEGRRMLAHAPFQNIEPELNDAL